MKILLYLFILLPALAFGQNRYKTALAKADSAFKASQGQAVKLVKPEKSEDDYGRGYLLIQSSEGLDSTTTKAIKKLYKDMWKDGIILYIGIQLGIPGGPPCGPPPRKPC